VGFAGDSALHHLQRERAASTHSARITLGFAFFDHRPDLIAPEKVPNADD
jgi:hypothetical protein